MPIDAHRTAPNLWSVHKMGTWALGARLLRLQLGSMTAQWAPQSLSYIKILSIETGLNIFLAKLQINYSTAWLGFLSATSAKIILDDRKQEPRMRTPCPQNIFNLSADQR